MTFVAKYISAIVFGGDVRKIWGNPYLNSTTILFNISLIPRLSRDIPDIPLPLGQVYKSAKSLTVMV